MKASVRQRKTDNYLDNHDGNDNGIYSSSIWNDPLINNNQNSKVRAFIEQGMRDEEVE